MPEKVPDPLLRVPERLSRRPVIRHGGASVPRARFTADARRSLTRSLPDGRRVRRFSQGPSKGSDPT